MGFRCGIVGLPNVGKSTIFNALTAAGAEAANYPFCTIEPNTGVVPVPDNRLGTIAQIAKSKLVQPTTVEFVDIAGLVQGASQGEGLGNQFLGHIRGVDAIVHVVRCFDDPNVVHVHGAPDPVRDIEIINTELMLADLESVGRRLERLAKALKGGDKALKEEYSYLERAKALLESGALVRSASELSGVPCLKDLLTSKPVLFAANVAESEANADVTTATGSLRLVFDHALRDGADVVVISGVVESEIAELGCAERVDFLHSMGLSESGLDRLAHQGYRLLDLITFFTAGPKETRAWTCRRGTLAPAAAGEIHTDFERGFIRAEVISFDDYVACGGELGAKEKGRLRIEGKDYIVADGDVMLFRFNV